jgi:hypothetical protein
MGPDVHFRRTYNWALDCGLSPSVAEAISKADTELDARYPARGSLANLSRHFAPTAWLWARHYHHRARRECSVELLGWALHCAQDAISHGRLGQKHLLYSAGLGLDPDIWDNASESARARMAASSSAMLTAWAARCAGVLREVRDDDPDAVALGE